MADFTKIYNAINLEFDNPELAMMVVQIYTINLTTKIKPSHLHEVGEFTDKVINKAKKVLWEYSCDDVELAIALWKCIHNWQIGQSMNGLGGCEAKTFKELLENV
jgi:hypothetical protein